MDRVEAVLLPALPPSGEGLRSQVRIRVALHVHSTLSHDGRHTFTELSEWFRARGFHAVAMGEHSQDMTPEKVQALVGGCAANSTPDFCMIPGVEFTCAGEGLHVLGAGCTRLTPETDPVRVARHIRDSDGFAVLAHPKRQNWQHAPELIRAVQAVEVWNIAYDGKYMPAPDAPHRYRAMRATNAELLAIASHDFHRKAGFYDMALEMDVDVISRATVLSNLRRGHYRVRSRWLSFDSRLSLSSAVGIWLQVAGTQLKALRAARSLVWRWSQ